jgi:OmcA/MtrC family decaheme c-type cytochrome
VPRRTAVVVENCNKCHDDLAAHGGSRNDPEYCVLCHNANKDTTNIPAPAAGATKLTTSLRLSHMIHRIHTGENGTNPFQVGTNDFSEVRFPGDRRDCTHCHVPNHYKLPLPPLLPSHMTQIDSTKARVGGTDVYMGATGAACTGCHDDDQTAVHVATQALVSGTDPTKIQEACATCHASGQAYGIDVVHARPGL